MGRQDPHTHLSGGFAAPVTVRDAVADRAHDFGWLLAGSEGDDTVAGHRDRGTILSAGAQDGDRITLIVAPLAGHWNRHGAERRRGIGHRLVARAHMRGGLPSAGIGDGDRTLIGGHAVGDHIAESGH